MEKVKCLIIGSGPAGYTAAIYAARANLKPVLYEGLQPGGQLTTTTDIENFPGYPEGVGGFEMMDDLKKQAARFEADLRTGSITKVDFSQRPFKIWIEGEVKIEAETVIISTGAEAKYLGLPSEEKFKGQGVSACATCDGFFYKGQTVVVVGGGDTACEEASYLSQICSKVYMLVRRDELRASKTMQDRVLKNPKVEMLWNTEIKEVLGDESGVNGLHIFNNKTKEESNLEIHGLFLAIGHTPNSELFKDYLEVDSVGYIVTDGASSQTKIPGVFAAGDVQDSVYRQGIVAAGSGCMAAIDAERFIADNPL